MFATAQTSYFLLLQYYYNKFEALSTKDEGIRAEDHVSLTLHRVFSMGVIL